MKLANPSTRRSRPVRTLVVFAVLTMLLPLAGLVAGTFIDGRSAENPDGAGFAPGLALDLEGGTQIILTPTATDGSQITDATVSEAINVIRQRIDANGVTEAEITSQGGQNIVVGIPGKPDEATIALVSQSAQMRFRPVLTIDYGFPLPEDESEAADDETADDATADDAAEESEAPVIENPSDLAQITDEIQQQFDDLDCTAEGALVGRGGDDPDAPLVTCSTDGLFKYILGPVEVEGTHIKQATSGLMPGPNNTVTNEWGVSLTLDSVGAEQFAVTSQRLYDFGDGNPQNQFAIVLDGNVVSAPGINTPIRDGRAQISGSFTRESAATLANQLSFGALPIQFEVQSQQEISATLGSEQLQKGIIAGLIGLVLVVVYSLFQYRTLGLLTVASLVVAGVITYVTIALLSWGMGYRLSLPGVAGLIVAIGFTADSFIVYFERIRDELRNGRTLHFAVQHGWQRARRTIYAAKAVNLISAVILYFLAVGGVQGFAFTLGLTTVIDVMVVVWFTHPVMELLAKVRFFRDGHIASGLNRGRLALTAAKPRYAGAGRVAMPASVSEEAAAEVASQVDAGVDAGTGPVAGEPALVGAVGRSSLPAPATDETGRRLTIAERRAAERRAAAGTTGSGTAENEEGR
ncbi:protein-export membrane protein SecD [Xylanimonas cellulosilytica DSM 15894]|uniref:Protein translocase subunit SecD n=1 Tax=Xylanimonas cellulosilytica (strain DSM 15894 / JCM 12276 / CECT 5975 / KCTC 9989 / LMG 20990 / NBRC 107835 / XIL07) TaxID=446471 RepID=D1BSK1_XYLCX|nr:protein translocase subunit SecD [Xylanimonas cellulosilytica]ACZ30693.1 protein-export membrane protein SecD [Xylanimonas cellulosilytica DSM 15894]